MGFQFINLDIWRAFIEGCIKKEKFTGNVLEIGEGTSNQVISNLIQSWDLCEPRPVGNIKHPYKIEDIPSEYNNYYDTVCCFEVLEHVDKPWKVASVLERITKPGGLILLSSPYSFQWHGNHMYPDHWRFYGSAYKQMFENCTQLEQYECKSAIPYQPIGFYTRMQKCSD